jgi:hypothetical protein
VFCRAFFSALFIPKDWIPNCSLARSQHHMAQADARRRVGGRLGTRWSQVVTILWRPSHSGPQPSFSVEICSLLCEVGAVAMGADDLDAETLKRLKREVEVLSSCPIEGICIPIQPGCHPLQRARLRTQKEGRRPLGHWAASTGRWHLRLEGCAFFDRKKGSSEWTITCWKVDLTVLL